MAKNFAFGMGMFLLIAILPFLLVYAFVSAWLMPHIGEGPANIAGLVAVLAWLGWIIYRRIDQTSRETARFLEIIDRHEDNLAGPFQVWWNRTGQHKWPDPRLLSLGRAKTILYKSYGGAAVVSRLLDEGYRNVISDDIHGVFGERGESLWNDVWLNTESSARRSFVTSMFAFALGFSVFRN